MNNLSIKTNVYWKSHILKASKHEGSINSYCRIAGISSGKFHYWKKRLAIKEPKPCENIPAFAQVEVVPDKNSSLPDPRWLAELILSLARGVK